MRFYRIDLDSTGLGPVRIGDLAANLPDDAAIWRTMEEANRWPVSAHLLATVIDQLNLLLWSKTEDGERGRNYPVPTPRPGASSHSKQRDSEVNPMDLDELKKFLQRPRE